MNLTPTGFYLNSRSKDAYNWLKVSFVLTLSFRLLIQSRPIAVASRLAYWRKPELISGSANRGAISISDTRESPRFVGDAPWDAPIQGFVGAERPKLQDCDR